MTDADLLLVPTAAHSDSTQPDTSDVKYPNRQKYQKLLTNIKFANTMQST